MKRLIVTIIVAVSLAACQPATTATFDQPQPENVKSLKAFPKFLQGRYLDSNQLSIVTIGERCVSRHFEFDLKENKDSLGPSYRVEEDSVLDLTEGTKEKILIKGDTILQHVDWVDTLFCISDSSHLRKLKGYFFLSNRYNSDSWEVKKLSLKKGVLTFSSIYSLDDIKKLKEITETTADTVSTRFILTRRQFKKFIKQDGFDEQEKFIRMDETNR